MKKEKLNLKKNLKIEKEFTIKVPEKLKKENIRIDKYLAQLKIKELYSRSFIDKLINKGLILINNKNVKKSEILKGKEEIKIQIPFPPHRKIKPEKIRLDFIYEDSYLGVINKPAGMVTHPAPGNYSGTVVNALLYYFQNLPKNDNSLRPGIVHRLDKDTSGLLIIAKTDRAMSLLKRMFQDGKIKKEYLAFTMGNKKEREGTIKTFYGRHPTHRKKMSVLAKGKVAITHYKILKSFSGWDLAKISPETGKTHQIRVHFAYIFHPIMGDLVYSNKKQMINMVPHNVKSQLKHILAKSLNRHALHANHLEFLHPLKSKKISVYCPLPEDMKKVLDQFKKI